MSAINKIYASHIVHGMRIPIEKLFGPNDLPIACYDPDAVTLAGFDESRIVQTEKYLFVGRVVSTLDAKGSAAVIGIRLAPSYTQGDVKELREALEPHGLWDDNECDVYHVTE
jgi:hypothetical protein